jgi:hypothetical protein
VVAVQVAQLAKLVPEVIRLAGVPPVKGTAQSDIVTQPPKFVDMTVPGAILSPSSEKKPEEIPFP